MLILSLLVTQNVVLLPYMKILNSHKDIQMSLVKEPGTIFINRTLMFLDPY